MSRALRPFLLLEIRTNNADMNVFARETFAFSNMPTSGSCDWAFGCSKRGLSESVVTD